MAEEQEALFGTPMSVEAPPEDQTADINEFTTAAQQKQKRKDSSS
jgi:hypothetical protein